MKVLLSLLLVGLVAGSEDYKMIKSWSMMKAGEHCWGSENFRLKTIKMKRAVAECSQTDAPELELPPFRQPYRFINTLMNYANQMEERQAMSIYNVMQQMKQQYGGRFESSDEARPYMSENYKPSLETLMKSVMTKSSMFDNMDSMYNKNMNSMMYNKNKNVNSMMYNKNKNVDMFRNIGVGQYKNGKENVDIDSLVQMVESVLKEKEMMVNMMQYKKQSSDSYNPFKSSSSRFKRQAMDKGKKGRVPVTGRNDAITLPADISNGDKLKEKLEQIQEQREAIFGNMTCVLRKMDVLNSRNELDFSLQRRSLDEYNMPDQWFKAKVINDLRVCNLVAEALPKEAEDFPEEDFNVSQIKAFMKCNKMRMFKTCMAKDVKEHLETYYGQLEDIVRDTQLEEDDLLDLMYQLMHADDHYDQY